MSFLETGVHTRIFRLTEETFNRLIDMNEFGGLWPWGAVFTDREWIVECDIDDPHFVIDPKTGEWLQHKATVEGYFLYRSHELSDSGADFSIQTFDPKKDKPSVETKFFKGILVKPPSRELKLNAREISFEEAIELIRSKSLR